MAKIRKFVAYRRLERPYTRKSKYREKSFIRASPNCRIVRHVMGDKSTPFPLRVSLNVKADLQIRDNALESSRQIILRRLEKTIGKNAGFRFRIRVYPHHMLRENPLAAGAGADRMSTGMKMSFGKVIGIAAQLRKGQTVFDIETTPENLAKVKTALSLGRSKLPCGCQVVVERLQ